MQDELVVAWAAGFFDGEGSISIRRLTYGKHRRTHYGLYLRCSQVARSPLEKFVTLFDIGSIRLSRAYDDRRAPYHDWCCAGTSAAIVLARLLPYFTVKRERALLALEFQARVRKSGRRLEATEQAIREDYFNRMAVLNLRQISRTAAETKSRDTSPLVVVK